ncbi:heavy metal-associated isoprenylated plant protein 7 [Arachis duranensis]|uniref:Heavy metal-associated isoprenylated plant protein 7 n=1 Tax=Arachis duranensis TaxID=130453 RepID=A0A6P4CZZ2_ARADU|nr:heavy metal-associated isoprenylated plant protein 7 [Arachis duranensis]
MGEEKKKEEEEEKKEESKKEEEEKKKNEEKKEEESPAEEIVLKVDMHCEACARKVAKALKGFQGVEEVSADSKGSKVVVKGKEADPMKVVERLQKKSGKKVELISPLPKPQQEEQGKKEEPPKKEEPQPPPQENKDQPPPVVTIVLKVRMHCEACAQGIQKRIRKIQGVESVETELGKDQVIVKGVIEAAKLVDEVYKRTKKHASVVKTEDEEKKEEEKKEEEKKKEEKEEQEKKEGEGEEKKEEEDDDDHNKFDIKRSEYWPSRSFVDYAYAPQIFSDENPNACSVM